MRRFSTPLLAAGALLALIAAFFGDALFRGGQFDYRDAEHFYYPLYKRVQAEWDAGRWPLWEPEENAGMPLLGQPTAAVLYPPKVVYGVMPYPWAARIYIVLHVALACAGMAALARSLGISGIGATLAGLSYGFGVPVVFQYCNVIFLVGAAWAPLGLRAVNGWLRRGRLASVFELAAVLAMETLGGDPETAYVTGLCAAGYAVILARTPRPAAATARWSWIRVGLVGAVALAAWTAAVLVAAHILPGYRPRPAPGRPPIILPWVKYVPMAAAAIWAVVGAVILRRWRRGRSTLGPRLAGLAAAAAVAAALAAAQLVPVLEFAGQTGRAADQALDDIYAFSLDPGRLIEFVWPNVYGDEFSGNTNWRLARPISTAHPKTWVPSLYIGGLTVILGLGALAARDRAPWRRWMAGILAVSLLGSMGDHAGPLLWARQAQVLKPWIGTRDMKETASLRDDGNLRDGDGSVYWMMATAFPGFHTFRYPSKLLTFTALSLAALAGAGWDAARRGTAPGRFATALAGISLVALAALSATRGPIVETFRSWAAGPHGTFGPLEPERAYRGILAAVAQGGIGAAVAWGLIRLAPRRARLAGCLAVSAMAVNLAVANARYISTCPQSVFDETPEVVRLIREAEHSDPSPGPFRVHRMPSWAPLGWYGGRSDDRVREFAIWQRRTLQPKHGINEGIQFTLTLGTAELYDYSWFLSAFYWAPVREFAASLGIEPGKKVTYYTRRGYDMWGSRYFVLPYYTPAGWSDEQRGIASFLFDGKRLQPPPGCLLRRQFPRQDEGMGRFRGLPAHQESLRLPAVLGGPPDPPPRPDLGHEQGRSPGADAGDPLRRRPDLERSEFVRLRPPLHRLDRGRAVQRGPGAGLEHPGRSRRDADHLRIRSPARPDRRDAPPPRHRHPGRRLLSRVAADDRRGRRPDPPRQPGDAWGLRPVRSPQPGLHLRPSFLPRRRRLLAPGPADLARRLGRLRPKIAGASLGRR